MQSYYGALGGGLVIGSLAYSYPYPYLYYGGYYPYYDSSYAYSDDSYYSYDIPYYDRGYWWHAAGWNHQRGSGGAGR